MTLSLELTNIKKSFVQGSVVIDAVKNANLFINKGEIVALTGPSGSGKTTLLQIAGLLDCADSGSITIDGVNLTSTTDKIRTETRKELIGFVYQFHHLMPEFSVVENVAMPLLIKGISKKNALNEASSILASIGLKNRLNHKPSELSGGEQQRVGIARAVVSKPSLILADEPTGNLDSTMSFIVFDVIKDIVKNNGIGCLLVTHNLEIAKRTDRIVEIKDGIVLNS